MAHALMLPLFANRTKNAMVTIVSALAVRMISSVLMTGKFVFMANVWTAVR